MRAEETKSARQQEIDINVLINAHFKNDHRALGRLEETLVYARESFGLLFTRRAAFVFSAQLRYDFSNPKAPAEAVILSISTKPLKTSYNGPVYLLPFTQIDCLASNPDSRCYVRFCRGGVHYVELIAMDSVDEGREILSHISNAKNLSNFYQELK